MHFVGRLNMEIHGSICSRLFLFLCACFSGILFALVWRKYEQTVQLSLVHNHYATSLRDTKYESWLLKQGQFTIPVIEEDVRFATNHQQKLESDYLFEKVQVLCLVFVKSHKSADAIKNTWSKRCNYVTFYGKFSDKTLPVFEIPFSTPFQSLCYAFVHVVKKYNQKFHWIIIADDSTYAVIDNLRHYVAPLNSSMNYYLGHPVKDFANLYNVGTASIVLSQGSVSLLSTIYRNTEECTTSKSPSWYFDQGLGKILSSFNVHPVDTRDIQLRSRFNPFSIDAMLIPGSMSVFSSYWRTSVYVSDEGLTCCSDRAVTFHDNTPSKMYLLEYLLYHLTVFRNSLKGIGNLPPKVKKQNSSVKKIVSENVGEPFVHFIGSEKNSKKSSKYSFDNKYKTENILNSIFGI